MPPPRTQTSRSRVMQAIVEGIDKTCLATVHQRPRDFIVLPPNAHGPRRPAEAEVATQNRRVYSTVENGRTSMNDQTSKEIRTFLGVLSFLVVTGCANQQQHIQRGNSTGIIADNRWDYYDATPIHYTSYQRSAYKENILVMNERTDAFSSTVNLSKRDTKGAITFRDKVIILKLIDDDSKIDKIIDSFAIPRIDRGVYKTWSRWYESQDGKLHVAIHTEKQIVLTVYEDIDGQINTIAYLPIAPAR